MNFGPQTASNWTTIFTHPTWILSTSLPDFADGHQQTELNQTLPNGGRYVALAICRRNFGVVPREKIGDQKTLHLFGLSTTLRLNGGYLLNETIGQTRWKVRMDSYIVLKFHKHWSTNGSKPDRSFYPPSLFCSVPVHRTPWGINVAPQRRKTTNLGI